MADTMRDVNATPEQVYAVLADGWTYSDWMVGTAHVRLVDPEWPAVGTSLHHDVGPWPLSMRDRSDVLAADQPHGLVLRSRVWPLGGATVRITIMEIGPGVSRITLSEDLAEGPLHWLAVKANEVARRRRNRESLRRLGDLAASRPATVGAASPGFI
jgi:hypothetical protein